MPKRTGYLYEQVIDRDNCIEAEKEMLKGKRHNRIAAKMRRSPEAHAERTQESLINDTWEPRPYRMRVIYDANRQKYRTLKIPCLEDQAVHHAVMRVTVPHIMRRNYRYNCGSIPKAGQTRITRALRRWLGRKTGAKYGAVMDIKKFYDNLPHLVVMAALKRIFKDARFIALHAKILRSMSANGVGLAIGFYPSAWYANIALALIDRLLQGFKGVRACRFMDDIALVGNNKRKLHKAVLAVADALRKMRLELKRTRQVFKVRGRGLPFLSYRFFGGYTLMRKPVMYRIARRMRHAMPLTPHKAAGVVSTMGLLKWCDSFNFRLNRVYPYVSIKKCKEEIRRNAKKDRVCGMPAAV